MKIRPLQDRVLVKIEDEAFTKGGIALPDQAKEKPQKGVVVAVGPGKFRQFDRAGFGGDHWPVGVQVGQRVLLARYVGADVGDLAELKGFRLVSEADILGVIEDDGTRSTRIIPSSPIDKAQKK